VYIIYTNNGTARLGLQIGDATANTSAFSNNSVLTTGALQHVAVAYNGSNANFYVAGAAQGTPALTRIPTNGAGTFTIGNYSDFNFQCFSGEIDEVRVTTSVRSANWWSTEYNNQNSPSTFWSTGAQETNSSGANRKRSRGWYVRRLP
jgi:hypothetical protein